ncbi:MAG: hypothetical protein ACREXI_07260, partial [Caldimonas sp.]
AAHFALAFAALSVGWNQAGVNSAAAYERIAVRGKLRAQTFVPGCRHRPNTPHIRRLNIPQFDL